MTSPTRSEKAINDPAPIAIHTQTDIWQPVGFVNSVVVDFQGNPESLASGISAASLDRGGQRRAIPAGG
jgi:hypothetical protein